MISASSSVTTSLATTPGEKPRSIINGTMRSTSSDLPEPTGPPTPTVIGWLMV